MHIAFRYLSLPVIRFLLCGSGDASALKLENEKKRTPLHLGLLNKDFTVAEFVAETYPECLKETRERNGWLPLHIVCANAKSAL